jgi:hypothetical protein
VLSVLFFIASGGAPAFGEPASLPWDPGKISEIAPAQSTAPAPDTDPGQLKLRPFIWLGAGLKVDGELNPPGQEHQSRVSVYAITDFGLRGSFSNWLTFESELMVNGGISLHGTSVFEGQAALQVRKQVLHLELWRFVIELGRVIDEASVDYFSLHVGDTFFQDTATRDALLYSGFNLGNGIRATVEPVNGLRFGLAFNAGNPVSSTANLVIGGSFPPFERFYIQPYQAVAQGANNYPDDTFHAMIITPSVMLQTRYIEARAAFQGFIIDTNMLSTKDDNIFGFNARGTVKVNLLDGMLAFFGNFAFDRNDTVDPTDVNRRAADKYVGLVYGGGMDFNYLRRFGRSNGIGAQYEQVQYQVGTGGVTTIRYANLGSTYWFNSIFALSARLSFWNRSDPGVPDQGQISGLIAARIVI